MTSSGASVTLADASACFDVCAVACTSTCASSPPTFAIATIALDSGSAVAPANVQSFPATGEPIDSATPGVPAVGGVDDRLRRDDRTEARRDLDRDPVLAHGEVVDRDDRARPAGDVEALDRVGPQDSGVRAQGDVDLRVGRVGIVDDEPLLDAAWRRARGEVPVRRGLRRARSRLERMRCRRGPPRPAPGRRTSRPSARRAARADRASG